MSDALALEVKGATVFEDITDQTEEDSFPTTQLKIEDADNFEVLTEDTLSESPQWNEFVILNAETLDAIESANELHDVVFFSSSQELLDELYSDD